MLIGVPREIASGERRVALVPEVVPQISRAGHRVTIERDAGLRAGFTDDAYRAAGAEVVDSAGRSTQRRRWFSKSNARVGKKTVVRRSWTC